MSNIDKQALRDKIQLKREILDTQTVIDIYELEALLDELEAKDRRLNEILKPDVLLPVIDDMDEDNLRHVIKTVCENYSLLHAKWESAGNRANAAGRRIAELEVKLETADKLQDSAFRHGLQHGFSLGQTDNQAGFEECLSAYGTRGKDNG
ncbi:TPA: ead/Ea22-like family protein [Enterobacter hormaechei subsp. hoffmannii]